MNDKSYLVYFLNSMKEELEFEDSTDFKNKIESNFNFKFKIQKFVFFLAKCFGWNNSYSYNLYIHDPYSPILADDYYSEDLFNYDHLPIIDFDFSSLKRFIKGKSDDYLESASIILFYKKVGRNFSLDFIVKKLADIKPYLSNVIIKESFHDVEGLNLAGNKVSVNISDAVLNNIETNLNEKITSNIKLFENFKTNYNSVFVLGALDYFKRRKIE